MSNYTYTCIIYIYIYTRYTVHTIPIISYYINGFNREVEFVGMDFPALDCHSLQVQKNASSPSPGRNHHGGARCQENWLTNRSMGPSLPLFLARHVSDMLKLVECSILAVDPRVSQFTKTYGDKGNFIWSAGKLLGKNV